VIRTAAAADGTVPAALGSMNLPLAILRSPWARALARRVLRISMFRRLLLGVIARYVTTRSSMLAPLSAVAAVAYLMARQGRLRLV
jgi:hypothetical protein